MHVLRDLLTHIHPGVDRYMSPRDLDQGLSALATVWQRSDDLATRYLALSRLLATIRCGHSYANYFNQSAPVAHALFERTTRLPFAFRWIDGAMIVTANHSGAGGRTPVNLPIGSRIVSIGAVSAADMLARLLPYVRADGHNPGKQRALLSVTGSDTIETFDVFHGLLYGAPADGQFHIRFRAPGTDRDIETAMPALTLAERRSFLAPPNALSSDPASPTVPWQWTMRSDAIAVLRMDNWGLYDSQWNWRAWLNTRLDTLAGSSGARGLIVDIRANEGGLDCGNVILGRYVTQPQPARSGRRLVRYRQFPAALRPFVSTWDDRFYDWGDRATPVDARYLRLPDEPGDDVIAPTGQRLTAPMVILTSAQNSSATFAFAQRVQQLRLGTLMGETTGGNRRGINGGAFLFATLPQSGIEFDVPLIGHFPDTPQPDGGIAPDIIVPLTADAIARGEDVQLDRAIAYLLRR